MFFTQKRKCKKQIVYKVEFCGNMKNEIVIFENQGVKLEVNMQDETVWWSQLQMMELF